MPPKPAKGKAKGKKDGAVDKDKESLRLAQAEVANLQQHIEFQKHDMVRCIANLHIPKQKRKLFDRHAVPKDTRQDERSGTCYPENRSQTPGLSVFLRSASALGSNLCRSQIACVC